MRPTRRPMTDILVKLGKQTPIYGLGLLASRLAGFLMLPIYTSYLSPADYGLLELLTLTVDVIGIIGAVGLSAGVLKFHAQYESEADRRAVLSTSAIGLIGVMSLVAGLGIAFAAPINDLVLGDSGRPAYFRIFFAVYLLQQAEIVPLLLLRIREKAVAYVAISLAKLILMLGLNIWLVVYRELGVLGILVSNLTASAIFASILTVYLLRSVGPTFSVPKFREMMRFGAPMMLWFLANFVMVSSDRFFLNYFAGPREVGLYSLALRFMQILPALTFVPFFQAWDPQRFELANRPDAGETFTKVFTYCNLGVAIVALGIAVFTEDVIRVMADPQFHSAYTVVPILLAAHILWSLVGYVNLGLLLRDRTETLAKLAVITVAIVLVLNYLLIPPLGILGAALATLAAYAARFLMVLRAAQAQYFIRYDWARVLFPYGIVVAAVLLKLSLPRDSVSTSLLIGLAITAAAMLAIYWVALDPSERRFLRGLVPMMREASQRLR